MKRYTPPKQKAYRPFAGFRIHAAFESPGTDEEQDPLSLDEEVGRGSVNTKAIYYMKVEGDCMEGSGIFDGDILVIDRSLTPESGDVIVGVLDGQHVIAVYIVYKMKKYLVPDNPNYEPITINECSNFTIEGVIPHNLINLKKQRNVRTHRLQQFLRQRGTGVSTGTSG